MYDNEYKTKENKYWTNDKTEPQQLLGHKFIIPVSTWFLLKRTILYLQFFVGVNFEERYKKPANTETRERRCLMFWPILL